ncbi:hypothetical protein V6N13_124524 [Hibiscus sabdariffa]
MAGVGNDEGRGLNSAENVLQKHVAFFDRNHDGLVYPWETFAVPSSSTLLSVARLALFVPSKFERIFNEFARTHPDALTSDELSAMLKANREPKDYKGWVGSWTEWKTLYFLCKDNKGLLRKETIRAVYDGSLFEQMERERSGAAKKKD